MTRVLIIDDDQDVRTTLRDVMEEAGYEVFEADDGDKGQRLFASDPVDLVVTDILMPEKEGLETILDLRRVDPNVKIIAISGGGYRGNMHFLEASRDFGANCVLSKPILPNELLEAMRAVLNDLRDESGDLNLTLAS